MIFLFNCLCVLFVLFLPFFAMMAYEFINCRYIKKMALPKRKYKGIYKKVSVWVKLFYLLPRQIVRDRFNADLDAFPLHGLHLFCGEQGTGKTIAMIQFARELKQKYPMVMINSNFHVDFSDNEINSIDDVINYKNGVYGSINLIDEIQIWFNSLESKNFPVEMIQEICQQRKQRKMLLGTSQVFSRVGKPIREQTTYIYKPLTLFNALTIVSVFKPRLDDSGSVVSYEFKRLYCFVHDKELRDCYDTYQKIERLNKKGFKAPSEQIGSQSVNNIVNISSKK